MKKIVLIIGLIMIGNLSFSQQNQIKSELDPTKSNGYLKWKDLDPMGYRIRIFEKQNDGKFVEKERIQTDKNYHKLNSAYLNSNKNYYRVEGLSAEALNDDIDGDDIVTPMRPYYPGEELSFVSCEKVCNGNEYAYSLVSYGIGIVTDSDGDGQSDLDENGHYILNDSGKRYLRMESSGFAYENLEGDIAPYYIAMDDIDFTQYRDLYNKIYPQHPLTKYQDYFVYDEYIGADEGFTTRDGYKFWGNYAYLVEKTLLQFEWMDGNRTPNLNYTDNLCSQPFAGGNYAGWLGTWNENMEYYGDASNDYSGNYYNSNPDPSIYLSTLYCEGKSSTGSNGWVDPSILNDWNVQIYEDWFACLEDWAENGYTEDLIDCEPSSPGGGFTGTGNPLPHWNQYVKKILFFKVDKETGTSTPIEWNPAEKKEYYNPNNLILEAGLYKMYGIFSSGKIIPYYFEYKPENAIRRKTADFVDLKIVPNPIQNNILKVDISSDKKVRYNLEIHSLEGNVLMSESSFINENSTKNVTLNVSKNKYPYNQIRVVLKFEDGSQVEKIAYRTN